MRDEIESLANGMPQKENSNKSFKNQQSKLILYAEVFHDF